MPAPANNDELLEFVQKSGVVDDARFRSYTAKLKEQPATVPSTPEQLAQQLIRDGIITGFQAEQLLQGKWKRFFLGKYKVLEKLGTGGMGTVFLCEHKLMKRRVAVKVLPVAKAQDQSALQRFYREARAVAAVDHPNLVRAYDIDEDEGLHFLVMEYVDGTNLQDLVKRHGPMDILRACHYIFGAAVGLHHANGMGLIHRDIKPANILVDRSGIVKILDMGLARFFHPDENDNLTQKFDENVLGTADYLAPEQAIDSSSVDIRADIYGLGGTFYFLLTGQQVFPEGTVAQKLLAHQNKKPASVRVLRPEVPPALADIVAKMLEKDPNHRFANPAELMNALAPFVQTPIPPPPEHEMPRLSPASLLGSGGSSRSANLGAPTMVGAAAFAQPSTRSVGSDVLRSNSGVVVAVPHIPPPSPPTPAPVAQALPPLPALSAIPSPVNAPGAGTPSEQIEIQEGSHETDTMPSSHADTARAPGKGQESSQKNQKKRKPKSSYLGLFLLLAAVLFLGMVAVGAILFIWKPWVSPMTTKPEGRESKMWIVSAQGGDGNTRKTILDALRSAGNGDVISIADDRIESIPLSIGGSANRKNIRIESANPAKPVTIVLKWDKSDTKLDKTPPMIEFANCEGYTLKGLIFEVDGKVDVGIVISGKSSDVTLEDVTIRNAKQHGVQVRVSANEAEKPLQLIRCRVIGTKPYESGVNLSPPTSKAAVQHVRVQQCRFEGPAKAGVRVDGLATNVELTNNRFFNLDAGVLFNGPFPNDTELSVKVERNTFHGTKQGVFFTTGTTSPKQEVQITRNYFARTSELCKMNGNANIKPLDNAHDKNSKESNARLNSTNIPDAPDLNLNPESAEFLKIPAGSKIGNRGAE